MIMWQALWTSKATFLFYFWLIIDIYYDYYIFFSDIEFDYLANCFGVWESMLYACDERVCEYIE